MDRRGSENDRLSDLKLEKVSLSGACLITKKVLFSIETCFYLGYYIGVKYNGVFQTLVHIEG